MEEVLIKSHLIVKEVHDEYRIKWLDKIINTKPLFKNNKPIFIVTGGGGRMELNTTDMTRIEHCAKLCTRPRGRSAVTTDTARIYIVEEDETEKLIGVLTHDHVKTYAPMWDKVGWR